MREKQGAGWQFFLIRNRNLDLHSQKRQNYSKRSMVHLHERMTILSADEVKTLQKQWNESGNCLRVGKRSVRYILRLCNCYFEQRKEQYQNMRKRLKRTLRFVKKSVLKRKNVQVLQTGKRGRNLLHNYKNLG